MRRRPKGDIAARHAINLVTQRVMGMTEQPALRAMPAQHIPQIRGKSPRCPAPPCQQIGMWDVMGDDDGATGAGRQPGGFASDLGRIMRDHRPQGWLFGHAHDAQSLEIAGVACRNVALGPPVHCADPGARLRALVQRF